MLVALTLAAAVTTAPALPIESVYKGNGVMVVLTAEQAKCPEGEKIAIYSTPAGMVPGCWFERDETVWIWWADEDRTALPAKFFVKQPEA